RATRGWSGRGAWAAAAARPTDGDADRWRGRRRWAPPDERRRRTERPEVGGRRRSRGSPVLAAPGTREPVRDRPLREVDGATEEGAHRRAADHVVGQVGAEVEAAG